MAGVIDTGITFTATETITSAKMNNIIDQTIFTNDAIDDSTITLSAGKLQVKSQGVTSNQLADSAATTSKVADGAITNAKVSASAAIAPSKLGSGALPAAITVATANIVNANVTAAKLSGAQTGAAPIYAARAWVNFDSTRDASGASNTSTTNRFIRASGNVASVLRTGTGNHTVTFITPMEDENYSVIGSTITGTDPRLIGSSNRTTTSFNLRAENLAADGVNYDYNDIVVFR